MWSTAHPSDTFHAEDDGKVALKEDFKAINVVCYLKSIVVKYCTVIAGGDAEDDGKVTLKWLSVLYVI